MSVVPRTILGIRILATTARNVGRRLFSTENNTVHVDRRVGPRPTTRSFIWNQRQQAASKVFAEHLKEAAGAGSTPTGKFQLVTKTPLQSYRSYLIPFSSDPELREQYINMYGDLRFGKILEDLDALAAEIAYIHADGLNPDRPVTIVTASCDRIDLLSPLRSTHDMVMEGCVTHVGRSSMVVRLEMQSCQDGKEVPLLIAAFTLVAKGKESQKPEPVHMLHPNSDIEQELHRWGQAHSAREKSYKQTDLLRNPPSPEDSALLHDIFLAKNEPRKLLFKEDKGVASQVPMHLTRFERTHVMMPQARNIHHKIFGGYIMRVGYELAWSTAFLFAGTRPHFRASDDIQFRKPVPVGSVVIFNSIVSYVDSNMIQVQVEADVVDAASGERDTTNVLNFSFHTEQPLQRTVQPSTYREGLTYVHGRRSHMRVLNDAAEGKMLLSNVDSLNAAK